MSEPTPQRLNGLDVITETRTCERHGEYESRNFLSRIWSNCPSCTKEEDARKLSEQAERAQAMQAEAVRTILRRSGIPLRFSSRTFDTYRASDEKQMRVLRVCKAYAEKFSDRLANGGGIVMCGMPGTGKTHLACSIAHQIAQAGRTSLFASALSAVRRVKETYRKGSEETEAEAVAKFMLPDLLILDEVGVQFGSDTEKMILFEIINGRYEAMRPTILISNLTEQELSGFVGERAMDRMREGGGVVLAFDWPSQRTEVKHEPQEVRDVDWERLSRRLMNDDDERFAGAI